MYLNGGVYSTLAYESNDDQENESLIGTTILLGEVKSLYSLTDNTYVFGVADTATLSIGAKVGTTETDTTTYDGTKTVTLTATPSVTKVDAQNYTTSTADDYTISYIYEWAKENTTTTPATYTDIEGATSATYNVGPEVAKSGTYKCTATSGDYCSASGTGTATINAAAASVTTAPTAKTGLTYTGSAQDLVTEGTATGGTLKYAWEKEDKYDKTKVKHITKNSLTTDDLASWKEGDIYQIDINSMDFPTIGCSPVKVGENTFTPPIGSEVQIDKSGSNLIFSLNGYSQISYPGNAFIVKKITKNGNTYSLELEVIDINEKDWKWTTETPKGIAVGTYPVYYKVTPTDPANYTAVEPTLIHSQQSAQQIRSAIIPTILLLQMQL